MSKSILKKLKLFDIRIKLALILLIILIFFNLASFTLGVLKAMTIKSHLGYVEGFVMYFSMHWEKFYLPIQESPYIVTIYPPTYFLVAGGINKLIGDIFISTRLLSIVSVLASATTAGIAVYKLDEKSRKSLAVLTSLLLITSPYITSSGIIAKPDSLALLFSIMTVYWYITRRDRLRLLGCVMFAFLALWTKQNFIAGPMAVFIAFVSDEDLKSGLVYGGTLAMTGLSTLGVLNLLTDGRAWLHMVNYPSNKFILARLIENYYWFMSRHGVLILISIIGIFICYERLPTVAIAYVIVGSMTALFVGKQGAGVFYFFELIAAMAIVTGLSIGNALPDISFKELMGQNHSKNQKKLLAILLGVIMIFAVFTAPPNKPLNGAQDATEVIADAEKPVLTWDAALVVANKQPLVYHSLAMAKLARENKWDQSALIRSIRSQKYSYVVLRGYANQSGGFGFTNQQLNAIDANYELRQVHGSYKIYIPS